MTDDAAPPIQTLPVPLPGMRSPLVMAFRRSEGKANVNERLPPAIFLHGLGLSSYSWRRVQNCLKDDREIIAVDMPGFGHSGKPDDADYSLPGMARAVFGLMDELGIARTSLVGHSLGGGVSLVAATMEPERVERVGLVGSVIYPQAEPPFLTLPRLPLAWIPIRLVPQTFVEIGLKCVYLHPDNLTKQALDEYSQSFRSLPGARAYQRVCRALVQEELEPIVEQLPKLKMPVLILFGEKDNVVPRRVPERLDRELPHSEYILFEGAGHMLPEEEPNRVCDHLRPFLCGDTEER